MLQVDFDSFLYAETANINQHTPMRGNYLKIKTFVSVKPMCENSVIERGPLTQERKIIWYVGKVPN